MVGGVEGGQPPVDTQQQDVALEEELMSKEVFVRFLVGEGVEVARASEIYSASKVTGAEYPSLNSELLREALKEVESNSSSV